ncbi:MAG: hypothetical protein M1833_002595 [Piccolia ochrophora]|nr:MAG: hypothetical protein M1833_002595 [Piccolia ochrophora]
MGRRKIEIKAIKDDRNRSVTFLKRKGGLFKKAHELSVLCSVDVAVIIFGHNKKLYEFSSGDINETIGRYQYVCDSGKILRSYGGSALTDSRQYGNAHEHKGPQDFAGKKDLDDDDDEDMASPPPESHSSQDHGMIPHHMQHQAGYAPHLRQHTPSASPPVANGVPYYPHRQGTPQPQVISRPSSRAAGRRTSSNLVPQHLPHVSQSTPSQNGYAYQPHPPIYNPQAGAGMPVQSGSGQPSYSQYQQQPVQHPQAQQVFMQDQRRQSMPPVFPQERPQPAPEQSPPQPENREPEHQYLAQPKRMSTKSKSIFTPVDESRGSLLAQHWVGASGDLQIKSEAHVKTEHSRSHSVDVGSISRQVESEASGAQPSRLSQAPPRIQQEAQMSSAPEFPPPTRTDSTTTQGGKRPRLKVQIPEEQSDADSATAGSSPRGSGETVGGGPSKGGTEASHSSGVVLPPPSPSASALLSAGAQGPPNPFARPNPPSSAAPNNNLETPISALPSRFMADGLLPSPSSFYPEWGFGRNGGDSNMLPSPLNFQTPVGGSGPSFLRDETESGKRKTPEGEASDNGGAKRMKV